MSFQTKGVDNSGNILTIGQYATSILLGNSGQTITNYATETFLICPIIPTPASTSNTTIAASTAYVTTAFNNFMANPHVWTGIQTFSVGPIVPTPASTSNTTIAASTAFVRTAITNFLNTAHTWSNSTQTFPNSTPPRIGNAIIASTANTTNYKYYCGLATVVSGSSVTVQLSGFTNLLGVSATPRAVNGTATCTITSIFNTGGGQFILKSSAISGVFSYIAFGS